MFLNLLKVNYVMLVKSHLQSYPCPLQINTFYNFGFLLGMTMIIQILTGIMLTMHYNSDTPWAMLFALCIVLSTLSICQVYMFKGIYFSFSFIMVFALVFIGVVVSMHYWFRDLVRDLAKKYEILLISLFLVFFIFVASEALLFVSFFWASFHSTLSPTLIKLSLHLVFVSPLSISLSIEYFS